jgi:hypothetical protein
MEAYRPTPADEAWRKLAVAGTEVVLVSADLDSRILNGRLFADNSGKTPFLLRAVLQ